MTFNENDPQPVEKVALSKVECPYPVVPIGTPPIADEAHNVVPQVAPITEISSSPLLTLTGRSSSVPTLDEANNFAPQVAPDSLTRPAENSFAPHKEIFNKRDSYMDVTEAEGALLDRLRLVVKASESPEAYRRWEALHLLEIEVSALENKMDAPLPIDIEAQPLQHQAARAVHAWIESHSGKSANSAKANRESELENQTNGKDASEGDTPPQVFPCAIEVLLPAVLARATMDRETVTPSQLDGALRDFQDCLEFCRSKKTFASLDPLAFDDLQYISAALSSESGQTPESLVQDYFEARAARRALAAYLRRYADQVDADEAARNERERALMQAIQGISGIPGPPQKGASNG